MQTSPKSTLDPALVLARARRVLDLESKAVSALSDRLDAKFVRAVELLLGCRGKVVVTGMGKSGHVCRKIAATLASTGTPALFLHPGEGAHGDLGVVAAEDVALAISQSGETEELCRILPSLKRLGVPVIAMTGRLQSTLAAAGDVTLDLSVAEEACPMGLAPTSSTTATLALGDALAVAVLEARGFRPEDFAANHPGGSLGRRLLLRVEDVMHGGAEIPLVPESTTLADAIYEISSKKLGVTGVVDVAGALVGVFTDGDLRRAIGEAAKNGGKTADGDEVLFAKVGRLMWRAPKRITRGRLAVEALQLMESFKITTLFVFEDKNGVKPAGIVHLHDLVKAGLS
jgi:arabinose-5-phosphate isomerase